MLIKSLSVNFALKEDIDNVIKFIIVVRIAKINQKKTFSVQYNKTTNKIIKVKNINYPMRKLFIRISEIYIIFIINEIYIFLK